MMGLHGLLNTITPNLYGEIYRKNELSMLVDMHRTLFSPYFYYGNVIDY